MSVTLSAPSISTNRKKVSKCVCSVIQCVSSAMALQTIAQCAQTLRPTKRSSMRQTIDVFWLLIVLRAQCPWWPRTFVWDARLLVRSVRRLSQTALRVCWDIFIWKMFVTLSAPTVTTNRPPMLLSV